VTDTVLVTGGAGRSGRWIVDRLAPEYDVVCVDRAGPGLDARGRDGIALRTADLADAGETFDLVTAVDPDAVVHWAAIPVADRHPDGRVFHNNVAAARNVLAAAGRVGARIVQASSDSAYGFFFAEPTPLPDELPIDESHPRRPEDPYGLSKVCAETVAAGVARRDGVPAVSVRPSWIQFPGEYACRAHAYVDDVDAGAGNFWSYVDVRDVVDLVVAALTASVTGHEAVNCVATDNALGRPLADLFEAAYGETPPGAPTADGGAFSTAKAARLFDAAPTRSWRTAADETVPEPTLTA
jgi:nucleoside-diphosphate-sugar epimerase